METAHHRSQVIHILDDNQTELKNEDETSKGQPENSSLDNKFDINLSEKLEFSRNLNPSSQSKKELYIKLDEILISSLHESFEVFHGATVDRVEMVEFLSGVVRKNLSVCPDLEKIMCLRDTVLTARVKRAFPEVEYKRKQIRQDHFRKAWLYVNIRKKTKPGEANDSNSENNSSEAMKLEGIVNATSYKSSSVTTAGTWTPEIPKPPSTSRNTAKKQSPLNTQLPSTIEHHPQPSTTSHHSTDSKRPIHDRNSYRTLAPLPPSGPVSMVTGFSAHENSAVVLDNYTIIKWVKMNYQEDSSSYVPVQDVVKAFKNTYGVDITYKECHQMIYSAFTSPRQRTCPLKTVRVSSMGAQYVYRGIAPVRMDKSESFDEDKYLEDSPSEPIAHSDLTGIHEEREDVWRKLSEELKKERDQSILDRNQAISALMDLEKEHAKALSVIEQLRRDLARKGSASCELSAQDKIKSKFGRFQELSSPKVRSERNSALASACENCSAGKLAYEHLKDERDQIWRDIVKQTTLDKEEARKRLEVVKKERDVYLERLHNFEKENQRLRDSVAVPCSPSHDLQNDLSTMQEINLESRAKALRNSIENPSDSQGNCRDSLNSVLSHLRSKRKQSTPTKFNKVPRLSASDVGSSLLAERSSSHLDKVFTFESFHRKHDLQGPSTPDNIEKEMDSSPQVSTDPAEMLLFFEGSEMVAFKPHPMED